MRRCILASGRTSWPALYRHGLRLVSDKDEEAQALLVRIWKILEDGSEPVSTLNEDIPVTRGQSEPLRMLTVSHREEYPAD